MLVKFTAGSDDDEDTDDDEDNDEDNDDDTDDDNDDDTDGEGGTGEMTVGFSPPRRVAGWR